MLDQKFFKKAFSVHFFCLADCVLLPGIICSPEKGGFYWLLLTDKLYLFLCFYSAINKIDIEIDCAR